MSAARHLSIVERTLSPDARPAYLASVAAKRREAGDQVHVWLFEHVTDTGRVVEFVEGADAAAVAAMAGVDAGALWRAVEVH